MKKTKQQLTTCSGIWIRLWLSAVFILTVSLYEGKVNQQPNSISSPVCKSKVTEHKIGDTNYLPEKIVITTFTVLTITDTAFNMEDIGRQLSKGYGQLFEYISRHQLKPGKVMAFYYTPTLPFIFDAAVEVNDYQAEPAGKIKAKKIKGGDAIVVHYQGPYDKIAAAYNAITQWLKDNHKKALEQPFEVYVNDPSTINDPQLLRTDVYQRIQ